MIAQFALRLLCGMSLMWCLLPRREISSGFFRIQMLIGMALSVLAALTIGDHVRATDDLLWLTAGWGLTASVALGVIAFVGSVLWTLERRAGGTRTVFLVAAGAYATLLAASPAGDGGAAMTILSETATALILGAAMVGMLLGHWYLTVPTMSIAPLTHANSFFGIAGGARLGVSAVALVLGSASLAGSTAWMWLCLRWLAGIVGPLLLCAMVWRILKYRNTQSATGVLFVGVILTFIGELSAALLFRELNRPF